MGRLVSVAICRSRRWCSATESRYSKENFPPILELVDAVRAIGKKYNATPGQVALAWLLAQGNDIIPIPGTKKVKVSRGCYVPMSLLKTDSPNRAVS